jgi:hypothetical protein
MARAKFVVGEAVEMRCTHLREGQLVQDWLAGRVQQADARMVAVVFETEVFANNGWRIPDRTLWCTHGSQNLRRIGELSPHPRGPSASSEKQARGPGAVES